MSPGVLIIVENLPVPQDRRVWQQALALKQAGITVSVICPKNAKYTQGYELRDGVHIFRHTLPLEAEGFVGFLTEYTWALVAEFFLAIRVYRRVGFRVIQACNPPDTIFAIGLFFKIFCGCKFVFDHHDPFTDLFAVKFPNKSWLYWLPRLAERWSLKTADQVITTSNELRKIALDHHQIPPHRVLLVRSGIDLTKHPVAQVKPALKHGRPYLALYIGVMGVQDGVDILIRAIAYQVHTLGRRDITYALVGNGTEMAKLQQLAKDLLVDDQVVFTGFLEGGDLLAYLATADIGLCPDPKNRFNDKLSMNKVLEYMAFGMPLVQFDLDEGRYIADQAAHYAQNNDPQDFAIKILELIDDPARRTIMGQIGRARIAEQFSWPDHAAAYVACYQRLLNEK
jgi:glycosyltransferase involved in cell wall biosynthesis